MNSTLETDDEVTVRDDGVTVRKQYMSTEFPVPAIQFEIESDLEDPVSIRLTESIPESFTMEAIGFHPEFHSDQWTAYQDHRIEFAGTLDPDDTVVTVYGIRSDGEIDTSEFLTEPEIDIESDDAESDDVADSVEAVVSTDANNIVKDMLSGERDSVPGLDEETPSPEESAATETADSQEEPDEESGSDDPPIELDIDAAAERVASEEFRRDEDDDDQSNEDSDTIVDEDDDVTDGSDPTDSDSSTNLGITLTASEEEAESDDNPEDYPATAGSVASRLASEVESGSVDNSDLDVIYEALTNDPSGSTRAKVEHLQQRVEDVAAYTGALEDFLDDEGTAEQVQSDLTALRDAVDSNTGSLDDLDATVTSIESTLDELTEAIESVEEQADELDSDIDDVADDVDSLSDDVDELEDDLNSVSEDVVDIVEWRDQLGSMFSED